MNRSWIAKLNRALCPVLVGTLVLTAWSAVQAAPLGHVILEGRKQGQTDWVRELVVAPGDVIEYRLLADLAPVGTTNGSNTINNTNGSGFQSLALMIAQDAAAPIQVDFNPPLADPNPLASFRNGWADGTGAGPGTLAPRAGGQGDNLVNIRPVHAAGVFTGVDPEVIVTGSTFNVGTAPAGASTVLNPTWNTTTGGPGSGSLRINGAGSIFITAAGQAGADPLVGYQGLTLTAIPEPSTIALVGMGLIGLVAIARRRRVA